MNREEAISMVKGTIERLSFIAGGGLYPEERIELLEAFAALRGPQPDPITGLVPCGCGGRAVVWEGRMHSTTYYVQCTFCGVRTVEKVHITDAIREFNTAMGWKGGAE